VVPGFKVRFRGSGFGSRFEVQRGGEPDEPRRRTSNSVQSNR
jgi:hypothetical protein